MDDWIGRLSRFLLGAHFQGALGTVSLGWGSKLNHTQNLVEIAESQVAGFFREFCGGWNPMVVTLFLARWCAVSWGLALGLPKWWTWTCIFLRTWAAWLMSVWDFGGWLVGEHRLQKSENSNANHANHLLYETEAFVRLSTNLNW